MRDIIHIYILLLLTHIALYIYYFSFNNAYCFYYFHVLTSIIFRVINLTKACRIVVLLSLLTLNTL